MVIVKIGSDTAQQREVEIVNEKGTWASGEYHIFTARFLNENDYSIAPEPHNINSDAFLGEFNIDKPEGTWTYEGEQLTPVEQKELADFILDYSAPDGVY